MAEEKVVAVAATKKVESPTLESFFRDAAGNRVTKHTIQTVVNAKGKVTAVVQAAGGGVAREFTVEGNDFVPVSAE